jgi:hypothetical protein
MAAASDDDTMRTETECRLQDALNLLKVAKCPNCDGSGAKLVQTKGFQHVTRTMALDAQCPEMEGMVCSNDEYDYEPCQWCDERRQLLAGKNCDDLAGSNGAKFDKQ